MPCLLGLMVQILNKTSFGTEFVRADLNINSPDPELNMHGRQIVTVPDIFLNNSIFTLTDT